VRWFFRSLHHTSRIERKDLMFFFHFVLILTGLGQDLTHLSHMENTESEIFLFGRLRSLIKFGFLRDLIL
jgi:hypothetical protein